MRIDAHQHFWRYDTRQYDWIDEAMEVLKRDFMPADLEIHLKAAGFEGSVAVQARQSLEETRWLLSLADEHPSIRGVVGWVDLCSPEVGAQLEEFAGSRKLVGVRHVVQAEPDDDFMLREDFQQGIGRLREFGLTYDILIYPRQLPAAVKLATAFPDQPFVLDHIAKPDIAHDVREPWETGMRALGRLANVSCKLSGMVTEAQWGGWRPEDFAPYLDVAFESFDADRLMTGSDWPVCLVSGEYDRVIGLVRDALARFGAEDQEKIMGGNCARIYGLESGDCSSLAQ